MRWVILFLSVFLFWGCSAKKITINAQMPAQSEALTQKRSLAVVPFKSDTINFTTRLESALASVEVDNKPYFKVINRDRIDDVLKELKLQSSDLVGKRAAKFGKLAGAEVIITGSLKSSAKDGSYKKPVQICGVFDKKGRCLYFKTVKVPCKTADATLSVSINAIDVSTSEVIDSFSATKVYHADSCDGSILGVNKKKIKPAQAALNDLADEVVKEYIKRIAPHYVSLKVELIEDVDSIDLDDKEEKMFENALTYIEHGRLERAEYLLRRLNEKTGAKSYEIAYDLGVVEEALGKFEEAKAAYELADRIILNSGEEPNELVDKAIKRINYLIKEQKRLKRQISE